MTTVKEPRPEVTEVCAGLAPPDIWARRIVLRLTAHSPLLALAYVGLAVAFMMFFLEGDILYNSFVANQVARGHLDVYSYFSSRPDLQGIDTVMPPLYYLSAGLYLKILSLVHLDPAAWNPKFLFVNVFHSHMGIVLMLGLLLLKLPNLAAVAAGVWAVSRMARREGLDRRLVMFLWLASPAVIVTAFMQAQNDVLPAVLTIFALLAYQSRRFVWLFLLLGLAASFKTYPLILVAPTALLLGNRNLVTAVRYGFISALPPVLVSLPFMGGTYLHRVLGAHDGNTLLGAQYTGRLPVHLWVVGYLVILGIAWLRGKGRIELFDVAAIWFLPLSLIFVVNWWVPQWAVWLLPAVVLLAARDRIFAWLWVVANAAVLIDNMLNYPGNMDGGMLEPWYGERNHPANSHFYNYHLFHIGRYLPYAVLDGAYIVCGAIFLALFIRALQWLTARAGMASVDDALPRLPSTYAAALAGPLLLAPYIGAMVAQRLAG